MESKSCLFEIHNLRDSLSDKEKKIADFILAAPREAVHPSIEELAELVGVSESTLFRFVRKLGYSGYQQFRIALATETVEPKSRVFEAALEEPGGDSAVSVAFKAAISALELTMKGLDRDALERTAALAVGARQVLLLGLGGSGIVAQDACHKLIRTGLHCVAPLDFHLQLMAASQLGKEDLCLLVCHTGANKDALALATEAISRAATLVVIGSNRRSPLAKLAHLMLVSETAASPYASEAFSARIAQLAIVDALYVEVMEKRGEAGVASLEAMRSAIAMRRT